ncbi:MAG: PDZ domain-containing protein [Candidatus Omnitrophota bacterium]
MDCSFNTVSQESTGFVCSWLLPRNDWVQILNPKYKKYIFLILIQFCLFGCATPYSTKMTFSPITTSSASSSAFTKLNMHVGLVITKENQSRELVFNDALGPIKLKLYPALENLIEYYLNQAFTRVTLIPEEEMPTTKDSPDAFVYYSAGFTKTGNYELGVWMRLIDNNKMPLALVYETEKKIMNRDFISRTPSAFLGVLTLGVASDPYKKETSEMMQEVIAETVRRDIELFNKDPKVKIYAQSLSTKKTGTAFIEKETDKILSNKREEEDQSSEILETLIQTNPQSFVKRSIFGIYVIENANKEIEIYMVSNKSSAFEANLLIGDIIIGIDDIEIKNRAQLFELIYERRNPGDTVDLLIKGKRGFIKKSITPKTSYLMKDMYALIYEITKNIAPVNLAVVSGSLNNIYLQGVALEQWQATMKSLLVTSMENYYLSPFNNSISGPGFSSRS